MKTLSNNKSKDKGRPKSHIDPGKQKSMEYVQEITTCDDPDINDSARDEYQDFIIDQKLLKSENTMQIHTHKLKIPVKVLKVIPSNKTQKAKPKEKVLVARTVNAKDEPLCKLVPKEATEEIIKPHMIIGSLEEYKQAKYMKKNGEEEQSKLIYIDDEGPTIPNFQREEKSLPSNLKDDTVHIDEKNALNNWCKQMNERKKQQEFLSKQMNVSSDMLLMNQGDLYRSIQEERTLIDRSMPSKDYGKGYRVGSEFWKQTESLGRDECVNITLGETEKGNVPSVEHVGYSSAIKREMGSDWKMTHRMKYIHYPWWKSEYLHERQQHLQNVMDELSPHKPNLDGLVVIGESLDFNACDKTALESEVDGSFDKDMLIDSSSIHIQEDPLSDFDNVIKQPIFGPSLLINEHSAQWHDDDDESDGVNIRLLFSSEIGSTGKKNIEIKNNGTTAIHYLWKKLPDYNPFNVNKGRALKRFFFNMSNGVILPGDSFDIPFIFKSPNAGIFTETWQLESLPVLCGKENILVTLHGIATECDMYENDRRQLEKDLQDKQNKVMAERILMSILASIKTPERPSTPVDNYVTDDEMFSNKNATLHFKMESISKLQNFYKEFRPDDEWDLSLKSLVSNIDSLEEEEEKELAFQRVNADIKELNYPSVQMAPSSKYDECYLILCDTFDKFASRAQKLNATFGLPEKELIIKSSELTTKKSKKTDVDVNNKSRTETRMNKKDAGVKNKMPKEKGKRDAAVVNKPNEMDSESTMEAVDNSLNCNYMEKLYVEVYDCLSEMAVNLESVLSS